ncbi:ImmA/IrrE family metallo-endopeptidase [Shewanella algae]|uniref:ImmA/IrrE family metallo-endopeptidase n=1 Tax=Shewanella algae TaxID=38313 RepID=UPI0037363B3C
MVSHEIDANEDLFEIVSTAEATSIMDVYKYVIQNHHLLPIAELEKRKVLEDGSLGSIVSFYVSNLTKSSLYRKSQGAGEVSAAIGDSWASIVRSRAIHIAATSEIPKFEALHAPFLKTLVSTSQDENSILKIKKHLKEQGIIFICEPSIEKSRVDGVAGKLPNGTPYIGLSIRLNRLDNFWFTLMHELGHIKLHYDRLEQPIIDCVEDEPDENDEIELEANAFASNSLIPRRAWRTSQLVLGKHMDVNEIHKLAATLSIHPAIVAGRVRKEMNNYAIHNDLISAVDVRSLIWGS